MTRRLWIQDIGRLLAVFLASASTGAAQEACSSYTVQPGDTLGAISMTAYGRLDYQSLYNANVEVLRIDPSAPPPGTVLRIPCEDGRLSPDSPLPETASAAPAAEALPDTEAPPETKAQTTDDSGDYHREIRIVSGDDWVPFADPTLTDGGLFLRIATTALDRAGPDYRHMVGWVEDWESHIFALLPTGAFDLATGWNDPDCDNLINASERTTYMCDEFIFSDPIYETTFGFFTAVDSPYAAAASFADLTGARLCRAEGNLFHDLEAVGLLEPAITLHLEDEEEGCLQGLLDGLYDVASFETQYAEVVLPEMGIVDQIAQSATLTTIQSSVAIAHKSNPHAQDYIDHLNRGLAALRASQEWGDIVTSTLAEAEALSAAE